MAKFKNKRGRPEKVISYTNSELWGILTKYLNKSISQICEGSKYDCRADTLRVRLFRQAKKIPLFLLHNLHSKSKYKSNAAENFKDAYLNTYFRFLQLLESRGIEECPFITKRGFVGEEEPPEFLEFCTLHFPKNKIVKL